MDVLEVKAEVMPQNTEETLVDPMTRQAERITKLEASQEAKEQKMDRDSSVFGSAIGQGQDMERLSLDVTPRWG